MMLKYLLSSLFPKNLLKSLKGNWAVVTGASDGIGKAYATNLAKRGFNVCIIARTEFKLKTLCEELETKYHITATYFAFDFSKANIDELKTKLEAEPWFKETSILINNVGVDPGQMMHDKSDPTSQRVSSFKDMATDKNWAKGSNMITSVANINMTAHMKMAAIFLPEFYAKNSGVIVTIASIASAGPAPYLGYYAASKSFILFWSESLRMETKLDNSKVIIQTICPGMVQSLMTQDAVKSGKAGPTFITPTAESFTNSCLNTIGWFDNPTGWLGHELVFWVQKQLLKSDWLAGQFMTGVKNDLNASIAKAETPVTPMA